MFKPLTRAHESSHRSNAGFAETTFLHSAGDDDYSGFAPTVMSELDEVEPLEAPGRAEAATPVAAESSLAPSWVRSQWVAAQEAKAHEAANQARAVIAAQRRADGPAEATRPHEAAPAAPRSGLARLRAAFERLLPGEFRSLLPLFIGVTVTMALISAVLPLVDRP